ncbi:hypothetical protein [Fusibacter sp. JL216-2]|uniref:hypothetical protein n=1 Tax=Fusibacter sp. JL216-2 TaxID=3071453 RepID=UPI003D356762
MQEKKQWSNFRGLLLYLVTVFVPFIAVTHKIERPDYLLEVVRIKPVVYDFLTYYKGMFIVAVAFLMGIVIINDFIKDNEAKAKIIKKTKQLHNIAAFVLLFFVLLSFALTEFKEISAFGTYIAGEGTFHWVSYIVIFFYAQIYMSSDLFDSIGKGLALAFLIIFAVGLLAYMGYSLFESTIFMDLITPGSSRVQVNDAFSKRFSTFFANPNHAGTYIALLLPLMLTYPFKWMDSKKYLALNSLIFAMLIFTKSSAGLLACSIAIIIAGLYFLFKGSNRISKKVFGFQLILFVLIYIGSGGLIGGGSIEAELTQLESVAKSSQMKGRLTDIDVSEESVVFSFDQNDFTVKSSSGQLQFYYNDQILELKQDLDDAAYYTFDNEAIEHFMFRMRDGRTLELLFGNVQFYIGNMEDGLAVFDTYGRLYEKNSVERFKPLDGYEGYASGRGYILSRGLPMLKDTLLVGKGADVFGFLFPHHDFIGKVQLLGKYTHTFDKPHNIYLFIGYSFGVVALVSFLVLGIILLIRSINALSLKSNQSISSICILFAVGMVFFFNDSMVYSTSIIFSILGGLTGMLE